MLWLLSSLLMAQEISLAQPEALIAENLRENLESQWRELEVEEHLSIVHELQRSGQYDSAEMRLNFLLKEHYSAWILFEKARNIEMQSDYPAALLIYEKLYRQNVENALAIQVSFRRAIVLSDVGRHTEAIHSLRLLKKQFSLSKDELVALELALGSSELHAGKTRSGSKRIRKNLDSLERSRQHSWLQARARYAITLMLLEDAKSIQMKGGEKSQRLNDRIQQRANLILQAEKHINVIIQLEEPEYALKSIVKLADAMLVFYDDLMATPPPAGFDASEAQFFRDAMQQKSSFLPQKAYQYYSKGLRYANELDWPGPIRQELDTKKQAVAIEKKL